MVLREETPPNVFSKGLCTALQCFDEVCHKSLGITIAEVLWLAIESVSNGDRNRDMFALKDEVIGVLFCASFILVVLEIEHDGVRVGDSLFLGNVVTSPWFSFVLPSNHEAITCISDFSLVMKRPLVGHFARYCVSLVISTNSFLLLLLSRKANLTTMPVTAVEPSTGAPMIHLSPPCNSFPD